MPTTRSESHRPGGLDLPDELLLEAADEVRRRMLTCCALSEVGHVGGCAGAIELLTALYFGGVLRYDPRSPRCPSRDRLLLRGHLGPARYAIFSLLGWVDAADLASYATLGSLLEGHETTALPGVDIGPSGSLGMILSQGVGAATAAAAGGWRTFVLIGDGEEQEGNISEAARYAVAARLTNLVAVIDMNGRQLSGSTMSADAADVAATWRAYGWRVMDLPAGNDVLTARDVLLRAAEASRQGPVAVTARTMKGHGLAGAARHFSGYHELAHCPPGLVEATSTDDVPGRLPTEIGAIVSDTAPCPATGGERPSGPARRVELNLVDEAWAGYSPDEFQIGFLTGLADAWDDSYGVLHFLYADTFPEPLLARTGLAEAACCRNVGIREQHLVALAHGLSVSDPRATVVLHTGDAFVPRAIDQLNAAAIGGGRFVLLADDAGITNCRNGVSHQSALTSRLVSALPEVTVLEPADGIDFALAAQAALVHTGITYIRVHDALIRRPIVADQSHRSTAWYEVSAPPGGGFDVAVLATGFVVGEAIGAATVLKDDGVRATVVNVVQPALAGQAAEQFVQAGVPIVTVYDGDPRALAEPVRQAVASSAAGSPLAALGYLRGRSGRLDELVAWAGVDERAIATAAKDLISVATHTAEALR